MTLRDDIRADVTVALKGGQKERAAALRLLADAMQKMEIARTDSKNADYGKPITDADYTGVVEKQIKQRRDSIEQYEKAGRAELAEQEQKEIKFFIPYLPKQMSRDEIVTIVQALIEREGKDFKKVMPLAAKELKGKAEGRTVNDVVKELTS